MFYVVILMPAKTLRSPKRLSSEFKRSYRSIVIELIMEMLWAQETAIAFACDVQIHEFLAEKTVFLRQHLSGCALKYKYSKMLCSTSDFEIVCDYLNLTAFYSPKQMTSFSFAALVNAFDSIIYRFAFIANENAIFVHSKGNENCDRRGNGSLINSNDK